MDWDAFEEENLAKLTKRSEEFQGTEKRYLRIHGPDSNQSYRVMERFVHQLPEDKYKYKMEAALEDRKPFRNFKDQADNSPHRQAWFTFKDLQERDRNRADLGMLLEEEE
ncbi:MAG: hypothetical protein ACI81P_000046 [Neolewinella sp.]|jgi:hypothetical protein